MNDLRKAAQQALAWIHYHRRAYAIDEPIEERNLRAALAQEEPLAGMSEMNRTIAYCAAAKLRELGYEWNGQAWAALAQPLPDPVDEYRKGFIDGQIDMRDRPEEQEPVAWVDEAYIAWLAEHPGGIVTTRLVSQKSPERQMPLYTHPPRRTMVPLTEEEIKTAFHAARNAKLGASQDNSRHRLSVIEIARAVEKAGWEKNHGQA